MWTDPGGRTWGLGTGKKWSASRRMQVRSKGILNLRSGVTVRAFQFPGSKHFWHRTPADNDNGKRMVAV
jgi:hypothetical protein